MARYRIGALPVGEYRVEVPAPGFASSIAEKLSLTVGAARTLDLALQVASIATQITVEAAAGLVDRAEPSNSVTIDTRAIEELPIRARNFTEFVQLVPNVTQEGKSLRHRRQRPALDRQQHLSRRRRLLPADCRPRIPDGPERRLCRGRPH